MKTSDNRRNSERVRVPIDMEFIPLKGPAEYYNGRTRNFSRNGLSFTSNNIDCELAELIMIKFKLLKEYKYIFALGDVIWKKQINDKFIVGVRIRQIDQESKDRNLDFPFNIWIGKEQNNNNQSHNNN